MHSFLLCSLAVGNLRETAPEFRKYPGNPIVALGEPGAWDSHNVFAPMVVKHDGLYWMYYSAGPNGPKNGRQYTDYQIGLATSDDGLHFEKHPANPLMPLGERDNFHCAPTVIIEDGVRKMWFNGNRANDVELATSEDGIHWQKHGGNPVFTDAYAPTVIRDGDRYRMWFTMGEYGRFRIGHAESPDGIQWTPSPDNPIVHPELDWEFGNACYPFVLERGGVYDLFYTVMGGDPHRCYLAHARSSDGLRWPAADRRLILAPGAPGSWDCVYTSCPCLVTEPDGPDKLYYAGRIDMIHKYYAIGVALAGE